MTGQAVPYEGDATRHLGAAAHVDDAFADEIITEFLTKPRRAIPPSPGLDPVVVLSEALAARRRRMLRDSVAIVLLIAIVVVGWPYSLVWVSVWGAVGVLGRWILPTRKSPTSGDKLYGGW